MLDPPRWPSPVGSSPHRAGNVMSIMILPVVGHKFIKAKSACVKLCQQNTTKHKACALDPEHNSGCTATERLWRQPRVFASILAGLMRLWLTCAPWPGLWHRQFATSAAPTLCQFQKRCSWTWCITCVRRLHIKITTSSLRILTGPRSWHEMCVSINQWFS